MILNINYLNINRTILHTIEQRLSQNEHSLCTLNNKLINLTPRISEVLKVRLINALGKSSKSFELKIENTASDSFFKLSKDISNLSDPEFILRSCDIANLLANKQKRLNIKKGYLLILDCYDSQTNSLIKTFVFGPAMIGTPSCFDFYTPAFGAEILYEFINNSNFTESNCFYFPTNKCGYPN